MLHFLHYLMRVIGIIVVFCSLPGFFSIVNSHGIIAVAALVVAALCCRKETSAVLAKVDAASTKFTKCIAILKREKLRILWKFL